MQRLSSALCQNWSFYFTFRGDSRLSKTRINLTSLHCLFFKDKVSLKKNTKIYSKNSESQFKSYCRSLWYEISVLVCTKSNFLSIGLQTTTIVNVKYHINNILDNTKLKTIQSTGKVINLSSFSIQARLHLMSQWSHFRH